MTMSNQSCLDRKWPEAAQINVRFNVGSWRVSGLFILTLSSLVDP